MVRHIIAVFYKKVYKGIMNKGEFLILGIDIFRFFCRISFELHISLIKSGGGNGPMKPGNLLRNDEAKVLRDLASRFFL